MSLTPQGRIWQEEKERTIREWNQRMDRLNQQKSVEPRSTTTPSSSVGIWGKPSLALRPLTNYQRWIAGKGQAEGLRVIKPKDDGPIISQQELREVGNAFRIADDNNDGYLDVFELEKFMEFRGCPMTHCEAKRLLRLVDLQSAEYISYDQVMYLVIHSGITTPNEISITTEEFQGILERMRQEESKQAMRYQEDNHRFYHPSYVRGIRPRPSTIIQSPLDMENSLTFFEEMASDAKMEFREKRLYEEYRESIRGKGSIGGSEYENGLEYEGAPAWKNLVLHSQDPNHANPPLKFKDVQKNWEVKGKGAEAPCPAPPPAATEPSPKSPKGLPLSHFRVPGRPQPFVVTQSDLVTQLEKIRKKSSASEETENEDSPETEVLFRKALPGSVE